MDKPLVWSRPFEDLWIAAGSVLRMMPQPKAGNVARESWESLEKAVSVIKNLKEQEARLMSSEHRAIITEEPEGIKVWAVSVTDLIVGVTARNIEGPFPSTARTVPCSPSVYNSLSALGLGPDRCPVESHNGMFYIDTEGVLRMKGEDLVEEKGKQ